jgi:hypothetical protein
LIAGGVEPLRGSTCFFFSEGKIKGLLAAKVALKCFLPSIRISCLLLQKFDAVVPLLPHLTGIKMRARFLLTS